MTVPRPRFRLLCICAIAALALVLVPSAMAAPLSGSSYDTGDGNQDNGLGQDWQGAYAAGAVREAPDANDDCFVGGVKELAPNQWAFNTSAGGCTPGKSNLRVAYVNAESAAATTFGHFAFFRNDTTGNTFLTFELNQSGTSWRNATGTTIPCRSDGDVLLSFEVGGSSLATSLYQWVGDGTGPAACPNGAAGTFRASGTIPAERFQGAMNSGAAIANYVNAATYGTTFPANAFGEAAIDLPTVLQAMGESPCFGFVQMQVHSRSSSSISSAMIDYTKPVPVLLQSCAVTGTAYQDTNGNGARDGGEPGVAGFELYADLNDNGARDPGEPYGTSGPDGFYRILGVGAGAARIREAARAGWRCTQPSPCAYTRTMTLGGNSTGNDFGNTGPATASGTAFEDSNGDGVRDAGEPGRAGVAFYADLDDDGVKDAGEPAGTSDATGAWSISDIPAGSYRIREGTPPGWTCSAPSPCASPQTFSSGSAVTGLVFGAYAGATLAGTVYEDANGDGGAKAAGDAALAGWQVYLDTNGNDAFDLGEPQTATDASGAYTFSGLAPGTYTVRVTPVASSWYCTRPAAGAGCEQAAPLASGQSSTGRDLALSRTATVAGSVFNDATGNGTKDAGEGAWTTGATVYVDYDGNGALDPAEPAATVDAAGAWSIPNVRIGAWSVREGAGAWSCTAPATCALAVTPTSGQALTAGQFGNYYNQQSSVSGTVLLDANANNVKDAAETSGLAGWTVYADDNKNGALDAGESNVVTNSAGAYSVTFSGNGNVAVRVVPRSGWTCSFPTANQCSITVTGLGKGQYATGKDFGVYGPGTISGTVVHDVNGNGVRDAGETAGLSGRTVYIDANANGARDAGEASATTDAGGAYALSGVAPGTYTVRLAAAAGWICSVPSSCAWTVTMAAANATGRDFASYTTGLLGGAVYEDANGNGIRDAGEGGLSGRTVYLDANDNGARDTGETTAATDGSGAYTFAALAPGTYAVRQVLPAGWTQTAPASAQRVTVASQATATAASLGSFGGATVSGRVFADANFDGSALQSGDALLSGRTVYLDLDTDGTQDAGEPTRTTDAFGGYSFTGLVPGAYTVRTIAPAGWACAYPSGCAHTVTLASQGVAADRDFGTYVGASVSGTVFEDADADGAAREPGETGVAGMRVYLDADGDATRDDGEPSTLTDAAGAYAFTGVVARSWTARVELPTGWTCDRPGPCGHDVTLTSGSSAGGLDFGVHASGAISGHLFTDRDHDGGPQVFGENDQPLRTVYVDTDADGTFDDGEPHATTDDRGDYTIAGLAPGAYRVREVLPDGWTCSTPASCERIVTLSSRQTAAGNDFSSWTSASFSGTVFEDRDGDGDFPEPGEPGRGGRTVYLDTDGDAHLDHGEPSTTTAADGTYAFTGLAPGTYTVRSDVENGWSCSYPATCVVTLTLEAGEAAQDVDFGAWTTGTVAGTAFDDADRSGARGGGEAGLAGRTIYADLDDDGTRDGDEPAAVTDAAGAYTLTLAPGRHTLRETGPLGWVCTAPLSCAQAATVTSQGALTGVDFGNRAGSGAVGGTVFEDVDGDGRREAGENGRAAVTVYDDTDGDGAADPGEPTTTTDAGGAYRFPSLPSGDHTIRAQSPDGWLCIAPGCAVAAAVDIDADVSGRDIAIARPASIAGAGFEDADADGSARESGDAAAAGWPIALAGPTTRTVTTAADGAYASGDLAPGVYTVRAASRAGWSCAYPATCAWTVTVTSGEVVTAKDFGASRQTSVAGTVFDDRAADGARDAGDGGRGGVDVWVDYDGDGVPDAGEPAATTDADGAFTIDRIDPGSWSLRADAGGGWSCAAPSDCAQTVTLASGDALAGRDFATWSGASIAGELYDDADGDGAPREAGDAPLDATVRLVRDGVTVATATGSAATGAYTLTGIRPGTYTLSADLGRRTCTRPDGCARTVTVGSGEALTAADFAGYTAATASGTVYEDADGDGAVGPGERGAALGVVWADLDGDGARTAADASAAVAADGAWTLSGLAPGTYAIRLEPTGGAVCARPAACAVSRTLASGETASGLELAAYRPASIAGTVSTGDGPLADRAVWLDSDGDGTRDRGEPATRTAADGGYAFAALAPGAYSVRLELPDGEVCSGPAGCRHEPTLVSGQAATGRNFSVYRLAGLHGTVSEDADADGVAEAGEGGFGGLTVYLDADDDGERDAGEPAATTAGDGTYGFAGLAPGAYTVRLDLPAALTCSAPAGCRGTATLASGAAAGGLDFAVWRTGAVSGVVFVDRNGDGGRDADEPPYAGATVFADADHDGRRNAGEPSATTGADGRYTLSDLHPGAVAVRVEAPAEWTCTGPAPCRATTAVASGRTAAARDLGLRKTAAPAAADRSTTGASGVPQSQTLPLPAGGSVTLLDDAGHPTQRITIPGQGEYVLDVAVARVTFTPAPGFTGAATPVRYRITDVDGGTADATYTPTVRPAAAAAAPASAPAPAAPVPSPRTCVSRRDMSIHWKAPRGVRLRRVRVSINGRVVARLPGAARLAVVDMKGRPPQTVRVRVSALTTAGRTLATQRTYVTCTPRLTHAPLETLRLRPARRGR